MVLDYVFINASDLTTAPYSADIKNIVAITQQLATLISKVKNRMDHQGDGTTWTTIENKHGIQSGGGQTVYNALNGANTLFGSNADLQTIQNRIG